MGCQLLVSTCPGTDKATGHGETFAGCWLCGLIFTNYKAMLMPPILLIGRKCFVHSVAVLQHSGVSQSVGLQHATFAAETKPTLTRREAQLTGGCSMSSGKRITEANWLFPSHIPSTGLSWIDGQMKCNEPPAPQSLPSLRSPLPNIYNTSRSTASVRV